MSWEDLRGWFAFRRTYDEFVETAKDGDTIVEIGVAFGRSLAYLSRKIIDSGKKVRVVGIDPWVDDWWMPPNDYPADAPRPTWGGEHAQWARAQGGPFLAFLKGMIEHAPEELAHVHIIRGYATDVARMFGRVHAVMIDGNHNYEQVAKDIRDWSWRADHLAGDDYSPSFPGVVRAVHEAFGEHFYQSETTWVRKPSALKVDSVLR